MQIREFRITVLRHRETGLLMAVSHDHKGLNAVERSIEDIERVVPKLLKALLEEEGFLVTNVTSTPDFDFPHFDSPTFRTAVEMRAA